MVFPPTPPVNQPGATSFSFAAIEVLAAAAVGPAPAGTIALASPPTTGMAGAPLAVAGTVAPSGTAVQVGLSTSTTVAPTSWTAATVTSGTWSANLTPSAAGTYYIWAEQTNSTSVRVISAAITVSASTAVPTITNTYGSTYTWGINSSYAPAASYSAAQYGAAAGATPISTFGLQFTLSPADTISGDSAHLFWTTTPPTTLPGSGEIGVTFGTSANEANLINNGAAVSAYACAPNTPGTYYLSVWLKSSSGTMQGGIVFSPISIS